MRVLFVPMRLRAALGLFFLFVPVAAMQNVVMTRSPYWSLPLSTMIIWAGVTILVAIPLAISMAFGRKWAFYLSFLLGGLWCAISGWAAIGGDNPALGFFSIGLALLWVISFGLVRGELRRSFFEPDVYWYEGAPSAIPGLRCTLLQQDGEREFRVNRIDEDGVYLIGAGDDDGSFRLKGVRKAPLRLAYRDQEVQCEGIPVTIYRRNSKVQGVGLQFADMHADARKEFRDFLEKLRGEGHE